MERVPTGHTDGKKIRSILLSSFREVFHFERMARGQGIHRDVGRQSPTSGAHVLLGQPNIFFVTVNSKDAVPWIASPTVQDSLADVWRNNATAWLVGYYLLMPDHMHFFCAPHDLHFDIDKWIAYWKRQFSRRHLDQSWSWQRKSFHHRLRNRVEYEEKLAYVRANPVRKNHVVKSADWPFQAHIHDIRWLGD